MSNTFKTDFGHNLRKIRLEKGLTQEQIYFKSGVSRSHLAMIETGRRDVTLSSLFCISRALGVDFKELFDFDDIRKYPFDSDSMFI